MSQEACSGQWPGQTPAPGSGAVAKGLGALDALTKSTTPLSLQAPTLPGPGKGRAGRAVGNAAREPFSVSDMISP